MAQDLGARRTEVSIIGNSRGDPSSPRLFAAKVGGEGVWQWAGAVRAFARMPTLATMRQSRRWVTPDVGHPPSDISCYVESETQKGRIVNLDGRVFWQQACGDTDRVYSDLCLKWDVILNGPGVQGPFPGSI